eukprot:6590186-Ditylum_brightwellii.AAC.1
MEPDMHDPCGEILRELWRCSWSQLPMHMGKPSTQQDGTVAVNCVCYQASQNPNEWVTLGPELKDVAVQKINPGVAGHPRT